MCEYSVRRLRDHIEISCKGSLTRHCVLDMADALARYDNGLDVMCDYTGVTDVSLTPAEIDNAIHLQFGLFLRREGCERIAFVAPDGPARPYVQSLCRMLDTLPDVRVSICDSDGDALQFLAAPPSRRDRALRVI